MSRMRAFLVGFAILPIGLLLLARVHPFGDAGLYRGDAAQTMEHFPARADVLAILSTKCADCHSIETRTPIYGRIAPVSWLMERDILEGRKHLNLSRWDSYSWDQRQIFKAKILEEAKARRMPLPQYRMIHRNALITDADVLVLTQWTRESPPDGTEARAQASTVGDPIRGKEIFEKRCTGCHALERSREGPRLQGVFGRASASVPDFPYSSSLIAAHVVWNESSLEQWLADPDAMVPGTNMDFRVPRLQERRDVISFLKQAK